MKRGDRWTITGACQEEQDPPSDPSFPAPTLRHRPLSEAPPPPVAPPSPWAPPSCLDELLLGSILRDHYTLSIREPREGHVELPRGGLVGVLRQDLVQKLPHHLNHLAGWGQGPQEEFLHLGHTHVEDPEVLLCGGSRERQVVSSPGPREVTRNFAISS